MIKKLFLIALLVANFSAWAQTQHNHAFPLIGQNMNIKTYSDGITVNGKEIQTEWVYSKNGITFKYYPMILINGESGIGSTRGIITGVKKKVILTFRNNATNGPKTFESDISRFINNGNMILDQSDFVDQFFGHYIIKIRADNTIFEYTDGYKWIVK